MRLWTKLFLVIVLLSFGRFASADGELNVGLTANPNPVVSGERVFYEISVSNITANDQVTGVEVTMTVPGQESI